ncbi:MAG: methyltransferase domain-containing protein [Chloroflexia bacterium]
MPSDPGTQRATPAAEQTHAGYDPAYFAPLFAIEDRHFWFRARNLVIAALVKQLTAGVAPGYRVLEVGCGTGNVLHMLEQICPVGAVIGMDLFAEGLHYARRRTACPLVQGDIQSPPFGIRFPLIGLFDVLEHLPDDLQVLRNLREMLLPGGALLITVPASTSLWSYFDEAAHHCRRYSYQELRDKLLRTGYQVEYVTPYMAALFPLVWLGRRVAARMGRRSTGAGRRADSLTSNELHITPGVNGLLFALLAQEIRLIRRRRRLPIGTSLLAIARNPPTLLSSIHDQAQADHIQQPKPDQQQSERQGLVRGAPG